MKKVEIFKLKNIKPFGSVYKNGKKNINLVILKPNILPKNGPISIKNHR